MKFFFQPVVVLGSLLVATTMTSATMIYESKEVRVSFTIHSDEPFDTYEIYFLQNKLGESFNEIHNTKETKITEVKQMSTAAVPVDSRTFIREMVFEVTQAKSSDANTEDEGESPDWQAAYCNLLRRGPFENLNSVLGCKVAFMKRSFTKLKSKASQEVTLEDADFVEKVSLTEFGVGIDSEGTPTQTETNFVGNCLIEAYNTVNNPEHTFVDSIAIGDIEIIDNRENSRRRKMQEQSEMGNERKHNLDRDFYSAWIMDVWANIWVHDCVFCSSDNDCSSKDDEGVCMSKKKTVRLGDPARETFLENLKQQHYPAWESAFCNCLHSGSYPRFYFSAECAIAKDVSAHTLATPVEKNDTENKDDTDTINENSETMDERKQDDIQDEEETEEGTEDAPEDAPENSTKQNEVVAMAELFDFEEAPNKQFEEMRLEVKFEFDIHTGRKLTLGENNLFAHTCLSTYNDLHDPADVYMKYCRMQFQTSNKILSNSNLRSASDIYKVQWWSEVVLFVEVNHICGQDDLCRRQGKRSELFKEEQLKTLPIWATDICNTLHSGPVDVFSRATNCQVTSVSDTATQG